MMNSGSWRYAKGQATAITGSSMNGFIAAANDESMIIVFWKSVNGINLT
jgi:hypothetical protein